MLVFILWLVKFLKNLVNNRIVDHLEKWDVFSDFQYVFRSSRSTADLLTVIDDFEWFWMRSLHKNIHLMPKFFKAPFAILHILHIAIYADDTTVCSKCDQASDLRQQLELAFELESDLQHTLDWGKKWLVDFNTGKTQLVSFDWSNNNGSIDVKMDGSVLEEKPSFKMLGLTFSSKLDWGAYITSIAKTATKKVGSFDSFYEVSPGVALFIYKLPYAHAWNSVVRSGLVPLVAT